MFGLLNETKRALETQVTQVIPVRSINKASESSKEVEEKQKEEQRNLEAKRNQSLLPWTVEQKVACCLNPIKIPIVLVILVLGCAIENRVNWTTTESWRAKGWQRSGPVCYVHRLDQGININHTFSLPPEWTDRLNETLTGVLHRLGANGTIHINHSLVALAPDVCGIGRGLGDGGGCGVGPKDENGEYIEHFYHPDGSGGLNQFKLPYIYFCLVWAVYKLFFMPVHWPDRLVRLITRDDTGEPMFKLMTQPYYTKCGPCMTIISKIGGMIRYIMLPNSLLVPLSTMSHVRGCETLYYYRMDNWLSMPVYWWCIIDFVMVIASMILGHTKYEGRCIGTWLYRAYRAFWLLTLPIAFIFWIVDLWIVFELRFWQGFMIALNLVLQIELTFKFTFVVDLVECATAMAVFLDTLQFTILVWSLLCPLCAKRLPIIGRFLQDDEAEAEKLKNPQSQNQEAEKLLGHLF